MVKPGSQFPAQASHYSLLKMIEDAFGLGNLGRGMRALRRSPHLGGQLLGATREKAGGFLSGAARKGGGPPPPPPPPPPPAPAVVFFFLAILWRGRPTPLRQKQ